MPPLVEDPIPPAGGDPREAEEGDTSAAVPRTVNGHRYLGWTRDGGHQYERPKEVGYGPGPPETAGGCDTGKTQEQRTAAPGQAGQGGATLPTLSREEIDENRRLIGLGPLERYPPRTGATNREGTNTAQRTLDASAAPWQPPLPTTSLRQRMLDASGGLRGCTSNNDVRRALGYPVYPPRRQPSEETETAQRTSDASADTISVGSHLPPDPRAGKQSKEVERPDGQRLRLPTLECYLCRGNHFIAACPKREIGRKHVCYWCNGNHSIKDCPARDLKCYARHHFVKNCPARKSNAKEGAAGQ